MVLVSLYSCKYPYLQHEETPVQDPVLLESEAVPPPDELNLKQHDSSTCDPGSDSGVHESSVVPSDDEGQSKNNEMIVPLNTSHPTPLIVDASPGQTTAENRSSSSSVTSIINTSSDSLVHHGALVSSNSQTDYNSLERVYSTASQLAAPTSLTEKGEQSIPSLNEEQAAFSHDFTQVEQGQTKEDEANVIVHNKREESPEMQGEVYSSVVSPQVAQRSLSPLNTLNLEQEMQLTKEAESNLNQESSLIVDERIQSVDSRPTHSQSSASSDGGKKSTTTEIDDRSLEQFSEILLDSDISLSDSETQDGHDKNGRPIDTKKSTKKVRFADEVQQKEHGECHSLYCL